MQVSTCWKSTRSRYVLPIVLAGMVYSPSAMAVQLSDTVQLHGFASQAYVSTTANKYFGPSDSSRGSFDFRELGLNLSWQPLPYLQFAGQVGSRKAGTTDDATPRIDYALIDFTPYSSEHSRAGVRAGRYRVPLGFYNQTRDVANTRPSIFLPESIYYDAARQLILALDGGELYGEVRTDAGSFFLEYGMGRVILDDETKEMARAKTSYVWRAMYEYDGGRIRLAVTGADANVASFQPPFSDAKLNLHVYLFSAQYNAENWSLTGEYIPRLQTTLSGVVVPGVPGVYPDTSLPDIKQTGEAYYFQGTYRIAEDWEALLRYDVQYRDKNDKSGEANAAATGLPAHSFFTKDKTVGIGWSVRADTKIRAEWHHLDGTSWLSAKENPDPSATKENWDMFALQVSYSF